MNEPSRRSRSPRNPILTLFLSSIDRVLDLCEIVFDAVDRPDLAASLDERLSGFRHLAGLDRSKPLGLMTTWEEAAPAEILFFPIGEIEQLLKTVTFDVVGYHQVSPDIYEIERPGTPYFCTVRNSYAYLADSVESAQALQVTPEQLTRGLRDQYEAAIRIDMKQIPLSVKKRYMIGWRERIEPWLQPQDDEEPESARFRKTIGKLVLDVVERIVLDTETSTIGANLDPKTRTCRLDVVVTATAGSPMANGMNRWGNSRGELISLVTPEISAGLAINLPLGGIVDQILGTQDASGKGSRLEAALQVVGNRFGSLSLIAALHGTEIPKLNDAIPNLIQKLEKSGWLAEVREEAETHAGVILHGMIPQAIPDLMTRLVGGEPEIIVGQAKSIAWLGIGPVEALTKHLCAAIDSIDQHASGEVPTTSAVPIVRARFRAGKLPELVASDLLLPKIDEESSRAAFAQGQDGFSLTIEPVENGVRLRIEAEEGFFTRRWT